MMSLTALESDLTHITRALEQAYDTIWHGAMADVPMIHPDLKVEAVGFQSWQDWYLGVLITPWFMNLVLLPRDKDIWSNKSSGEKQLFQFEAGEFEFIFGYTEGFGGMLSCSLFSPMFDFEDHPAAVATAQAVMSAIFDRDNQETDQAQDLTPEKKPAVVTPSINKEPLSRREFFRGKFFSTGEETQASSSGETR